jgi:asparagine synthase (glutamine-hydrolysing)
MPGIAGLITKMPREQAVAQLSQMVETLRHESFYVAGTWIDESAGIYVGWTALENSFASAMPLFNERNDVCLVFSGEEYAEPGTACRLKELGHSLDKGEASYLVHVYEQGPEFPRTLNGLFHGLVVDQARGVATLFNDRFGMHRLYFHESKDAFYFAAEAKAILTVHPELRTANPDGLGEFVSCSCVLGNRTIFKDVHLLPAASAWVFRGGAVEHKTTYFRPCEWEKQASLEPEAYYQALRGALAKNLPLYFGGRERMGMALTGGLDTRVILSQYSAPAGSLSCYTFGGMFRESEDVRIARQISNLCHQSHEVITVGDDFLAQFAHYAERTMYLTEGGVDVYRASDLYVSEKARKIAPVKVVGTYGSEIVRQAVMFKAMTPPPGLFKPEFLAYVEKAAGAYAALRREHPLTFAAFRQSPWYHHAVLALESTQLTVRSPFLDNEFVRTVFRAPQSEAMETDVRLRLIQDGDPELAKIPSDRGVGGNYGKGTSAANRAYLEFTFKAEYAYDYGMPQSVARVDHAFSALHLERLFLGRHKLTHYRVWYRDQLSKYVREILLDPRTLSRPYLESKKVEAVVEGHTKNGLNYTSAIHKLLSLELLERQFFDVE